MDAIEALTRRWGYRLVIPTSDSSLVLLAGQADRLGRERLAIPNRLAVETFTDKAPPCSRTAPKTG